MPRFLLPGLSAAVLLASMLSGCSGPAPPTLRRELPEGFPHHSVADIRAHLAHPADTLRAFRAQARLTLETPTRNGTYSAEIRHRRGDSLYLSISPGLGIEVVRVLVTPDSFFVYNRLKNRLTYGALADAAARLPIPLPTEATFEVLLGLLVPATSIDWQLTADSSYYHLRASNGRIAYTVDPAFWRTTRYAAFDVSSTLVEARTYGAFDRFEGVYLPRRVEVRHPAEEARIALYYERLQLNPGALSFDLHVKEDTDRVLISRSFPKP